VTFNVTGKAEARGDVYLGGPLRSTHCGFVVDNLHIDTAPDLAPMLLFGKAKSAVAPF